MGAAATAAVWIAAFTVLRGVANFALQVAVAAKFGASNEADAYFVVVGFGLVISELLAGVLTVSVLPTLIHVRHAEGEHSARRLEQSILTWCVGMLIAAAIIVAVSAPLVVRVLAPGFSPSLSELSTDLLRFSVPGLLIYGCALLFGLALQVRGAFVSTAAVPVLPFLGATAGLAALPGKSELFNLMAGFTVGASAAFLIQIVNWKRVSRHRRINVTFRHRALPDIAKLVWPSLLATGSVFFLQVVLRMTASDLGVGRVAAVGFAIQVAGIPVALLTTPVGTVLLPRLAVLMRDGNLGSGAALLNEAVLFVTLGSALTGALLYGLAAPITEVLFQRGNFTARDSALTADALRWLAAGLFAVSATSVLSRGFVAATKVRPLAIVWVATLMFFLGSSYAVRAAADVGMLAATYSAAYVFALVALLALLRREGAGMPTGELVRLGARLTASAALAGIASWGVDQLTLAPIESLFGEGAGDVIRLAAGVLVGGAVFFAATFAMRGEEAAAVRQWVRVILRHRDIVTPPVSS